MSAAPTGAGSRHPPSSEDRLGTWCRALTRAELIALFWVDPDELERGDRREGGETALRAATLGRVAHALGDALGSDDLILHWLRARNAELHGETPIAWMAGPTRMITQVALRLERENARRWTTGR